MHWPALQIDCLSCYMFLYTDADPFVAGHLAGRPYCSKATAEIRFQYAFPLATHAIVIQKPVTTFSQAISTAKSELLLKRRLHVRAPNRTMSSKIRNPLLCRVHWSG